MKIRAFLVCVLSLAIIMIAGCTGTNAGDNNTTGTTAKTSVSASDAEEMADNGEYDAGEDGVVTDSRPDDSNAGGDDADRTEVTDDGVVTSGGSDTTEITDEAAFAPSYIDVMAEDKKICWGLGKARDKDNRPVDAVNAEKEYGSLNARFTAPDNKICLTFDEGYENGYTAEILDTLKEKNVRAMFFVTLDYCKDSPELIERMIAEGHVVGNHTSSHPSMPECSEEKMTEEIKTLHDYVRENFGYDMKYFRFPKGEFSGKALSVVKNLGYESIFWSFAYNDWNTDNQPDKAEALARIKESLHSGIYLLHAVSETNTEILGSVIDFWRENGYTVTAEL